MVWGWEEKDTERESVWLAAIATTASLVDSIKEECRERKQIGIKCEYFSACILEPYVSYTVKLYISV